MTRGIIILCALVFPFILYIISHIIAWRSRHFYDDIIEGKLCEGDRPACYKAVRLLSAICKAIWAIQLMTLGDILVIDIQWSSGSIAATIVIGVLVLFVAFTIAAMSFISINDNRTTILIFTGIYVFCIAFLTCATIYLCSNCTSVTSESDGTVVIEENLTLDEVKEYYSYAYKFNTGDSTTKIEFIEDESSKPYVVIHDYAIKKHIKNKAGKILYELSLKDVHDMTLYIPIN